MYVAKSPGLCSNNLAFVLECFGFNIGWFLRSTVIIIFFKLLPQSCGNRLFLVLREIMSLPAGWFRISACEMG